MVTRQSSRPYHHGNLAAALVEAGVEMVAEGGPDALVLRAVARRVGVSPTAAYRHFDGQAGLIDAVRRAAMQRFADHLETAMTQPAGSAVAPGRVDLPGVADGSRQEYAIRRLESIGRAYFDFAVTQPGLFRSFCIDMPGGGDPGADPPGAMDEDPAFGVLTRVLDELVEAGVIDEDRRAAQIDIALWSAVHGLSVLCVDGPLAGLPRQAQYEMLTAVTDVVFHGLAGGNPARSGTAPAAVGTDVADDAPKGAAALTDRTATGRRPGS